MVNRGMTDRGPAPRPKIKDEMRRLASVPTLTDAPKRMLAAAATDGYIVRVGANWPLLTERTAPDRAYILLDGTVDVYRSGLDLGPCRSGEILGELGIVNRRLRAATVVTRGPVTVLHLSKQVFENLFDQERYFRDLVREAMVRKTM